MKPEITYDDFAKLDLRIATVLAAKEHPNADRLMLLQIKVDDTEKQIVAGIRGHYTPSSWSAGRSWFSTICKRPCCGAKSRKACCWRPATPTESSCCGPTGNAKLGRR